MDRDRNTRKATTSATKADERTLQVLSTEHWSLLSSRSLVYNEAFTRGGMFLSFLSMSFVGLALGLQALGATADFLVVAAVVLSFDLIIGLTTYARVIGANYEDYLALRGMARIRHVYGQIAPTTRQLFVSPLHDDLAGVMVAYGDVPSRGLGAVIYAFSSSGGLVALVTSLIGALLVFVSLMLTGLPPVLSAAGAAIAFFVLLFALVIGTMRYWRRAQSLPALYPTPPDSSGGS